MGFKAIAGASWHAFPVVITPRAATADEHLGRGELWDIQAPGRGKPPATPCAGTGPGGIFLLTKYA